MRSLRCFSMRPRIPFGTLLTVTAMLLGCRPPDRPAASPPAIARDDAPASTPDPTSTPVANHVTDPIADPALLERCRHAAAYSRTHDGDGVLVLRDGGVVFADFRSPTTADTPHLLASGTKSFAGVAAVLAVSDGLLQFDELVSDTIVEWKTDPAKSSITIRQLLSLASGLESLSAAIDSAQSARAAGITDRAKASIDASLRAAPGERFLYGPSSFYVFGELMQRKLSAAKTGDSDVVAYLQRRVFDPLNIAPVFMRDPAGNANLPGGCRIGAQDWATFGELIRNRGSHDGVQLLDATLLDEMLAAHGPNPRYGLTWWILSANERNAEDEIEAEMVADRLLQQGGPIRERVARRLRERAAAEQSDAPKDAATGPRLGVMAAGKGKQRLYILPDERMTVVRFGALNGLKGFEDREFLRRLLGE